MKNSEYWEKRIANNTWGTYNSLEEKNRALLEMYQEASLNISEELYKVAEKVKTSTPMLSDMHKYNRLTELQKNIENIIRSLGENVESFGKDNMLKGFKDNYSNIMAQLGITEFDKVPKKIMEEMLRKSWLGDNFSTRLWKNTQVLASNLNDLLTTGLIQGKTITEIAIQLNNRMNEGFNVSHRLVRTETMHYLNESSKKAYKDGGCEEVQIWAAVDERTCPTCGIKHGNVYKLKDCPTLPLHANCRCTILPVIDLKSTNEDHDKAKEDVNNEFNRRKIPQEKIKQKKKDNYEKDKLQYKKYKEILGKEVAKSLEDFQEMKYNNINKWEDLKGYYKYKINNPLSDRIYYNINKDIKGLIGNGVVSETIGIAVKPIPVEYESIHKHARKRMDKRNVTEYDAKGFIINSKVMFKQNAGQKYVYYSSKGVAAVVVDEKLLVTVFSNNDYDEGAKAIMEVVNKYGI